MRAEYRVLGPLEVLRANQLVPVDELVATGELGAELSNKRPQRSKALSQAPCTG